MFRVPFFLYLTIDLGKIKHHAKANVFFYFLFYRFFSQQVSVAGRNKNKIHSDHFPIELKLKETQFVFPSILIQLENGPNEIYFYFTN